MPLHTSTVEASTRTQAVFELRMSAAARHAMSLAGGAKTDAQIVKFRGGVTGFGPVDMSAEKSSRAEDAAWSCFIRVLSI
jgi:hypothetical protein